MSLQEQAYWAEVDRANRKQAIAEGIENDLDAVTRLTEFALGSDGPDCDSQWMADVLVALRESKLLLKSLCEGDTLEQAMAKHPGSIDHFRTLLRCADDADTWIAKLISEEAEERL